MSDYVSTRSVVNERDELAKSVGRLDLKLEITREINSIISEYKTTDELNVLERIIKIIKEIPTEE
jgi:hypothetical protein